MGILRQSSFAILAVAVVVASLVFLYPGSSAAATTVTLGASGISAVDNGADADGTTQADNFFDVTFTIDLAAGEHIPLSYAEVRVAATGAALDGDGKLTGAFCTATTGGTPSAEIRSIDGSTQSSGPFVGTGYDVVDSGYGFVFSSPSPVDFSGYNGGTGYGYGGNTAGADLITITIRVTGCTLPYSLATSFADVRVQALVGANSALNFWSTPAEVSLFDPGFTTGVTTPAGTVALPGEATASGSELSFEFQVDNTANIGSGSTLTLDLTGTDPDSMGGTASIVTEAVLPAGTTITMGFYDVTTDPSVGDDMDLVNNPPFGINAAALLARTANPPAGFFTLSLQIPGVANADENAFIRSFTVTLSVPQAYATARGLAIPNGLYSLEVVGFDDVTGDLDSRNGPSAAVDCVIVPTTCQLTFTITRFSSFALVVRLPTGGGGDGATTAPPATSTITSTGTDGTVVTTTVTGPASGTDAPTGEADGEGDDDGKKNGIPGPAPILLLGALAAVAFLARRRLR